MSRTDWDSILKVDVGELSTMPTDDIDILYELMCNIGDIDEVNDVPKLRHAFNVAQFIMSYKAEDNKGLTEELDENQMEIKKLKNIKEELEKENAALQRSDGGMDINIVREKRNWEMEKETMMQEIRDLKSKFNSVTEQSDAKDEKIDKYEKEISVLKDANTKLSDNVEFLRQRTNQLKSQKDQTQDSNKSELAYTRSELRQKKIDLDNAQEKILELHQEIDRLKENLQMSTEEIERMTNEYRNMKSHFGLTDGDLQSAEAECKMLRLQIAHLQEQLSDKNDTDDKIMNHVNEQVTKWKQIMDERDSEICRLYEDNSKLRFDLQKSGINSEKANVQALVKLVKEREQEVQDLSKQLVEATRTIEENTEMIANLKKDLDRTGGGSAGHQMRRIKELRQLLDDKEQRMKETVSRLEIVENQAADKERDLTEALERNKMYEKGEFGLAEAVGEIKACKAQLQVKERQMEQLCQEVNKVNYALEEMKFENGHLRTKLGIPLDEQLDIEGYKRQKAAQDEEERAINIVLQKEIEKLEDERLTMKKKIRVLARQAGLRAGSAGMEAGDVMEEYRNIDLVDNETVFSTHSHRDRGAPAQHTWKIKEQIMNKELYEAVQNAEKQENNVAQMTAKNGQLQKENDTLFEAIKQLKEEWVLRNNSSTNKSGIIECPVLDKLLVAMETKRLIGDFDTGIYMKTRIDNLEGRNEELRSELRNSRIEFQKVQLDNEKLKQRLKIMDPMDFDMEHVELSGLPENMNASSSQTIASLNQHLVFVLQEKSLKEEALDKMDKALDNYRRKFALIRHQQGLLYRQYAEEKQKYELEIESLKTKLKDIEGVRSEDNVRIVEFNKLLNNLNQDESEIKQRLADLTRQIIVLKVNETALSRRYAAMQEMEQTMRRDNNKLKNEMIQIEGVVTDRMGYYRRFKETANYKLNVLQKELDESVPGRDMAKLQLKFDELTEKYRSFLEKQNILIGRGESIIQIENELNKLKMDHEALKKILEKEKECRHVLEAAFDEMGQEPLSDRSKKGNVSPRKGRALLNDAHLISISKKVTTLEMKEINERERADHAVRMYETIKHTWNEAEKRNKGLEEKLSQLTNANLELQKIERALRDELVDSVSKEINDHEKWKVLELEKRDMAARHEIETLKEIAEIATMQANTLQQQQLSRDKEVTSLRQQLLDIQCQTDEKSLIGKLHRHIVQLQLSETSALRKLDDVQRTQKRLESQLLKIEQFCDDKDQSLYHTRLEARARVKHLKNAINSLLSQFAGSIPLVRQERFTCTLIQLTEEKIRLDHELQKVIHEKFDMETQLESIKLVNENQKELADALKNRRNEKNVLELWSNKMEQLRVDTFKQKRQTDLLRHEVEHLESIIKCQESQLSQVDGDILQMSRDHDEKQLIWDQRENELERIIHNLENVQGDVIMAAHSFQEASGKKQYFDTMPDPSAPLPNQLEHAVSTIKKNISIIFDKESENRSLKKHVKDLEIKIREMEGTLLKRERYINELRLRLPASEDREEKMGKISEAAAVTLLNQDKNNYVDEKTVWAAQTTLAGLQDRLQAKDESLLRYEELLKEAREDLVACNQRHSEEVNYLKDKLKTQNPSKKMEYSSPPATNVVTSDKLRENNELRDLLVIQTRNNEDLKFKINELQRQLSTEKYKQEANEKLFQTRLKDADMRTENEALDLKENINHLKRKLNEKENKLDFQNQEISKLKADVMRSPNSEMKNAVAKLTEQLRDKEKQLQTLKSNLADFKKAIADQSIETLRMTKNEMSKQENIQKILDKHTRDLSNELEAQRDQVLQYQRELRAARADKDQMQMELDGMKADFDHKDSLFKKSKGEKNKLEQENEDLRNQLQRIKNIRSLSSNDALKQELDATKMRLHLIEEENNRLKKHTDKPVNPKQEIDSKIAQWENGKKNKKAEEKLKEKLSEKENELMNLGKQLDMTTKVLDRLRKEKQVLEGRLTDKWGPGALLDINEDIEKIVPIQAKKAFSSPSIPESIEDLKKKNLELEREINRLCRDGGIGENKIVNNIILKDAEMRNRLLQKNIEDLERRLIQSGNASGITLEKERAMQKEIVRLNSDNLELKFEVESARKEIPRFKTKVEDLKKFVELLKSEKEALESKSNRSLDSSATTMSNIKKIGDSGKSTKELEKMIARMKKVVERTQEENEKLKEAPGVVMNEQIQLLRSENANLKQDLAELRSQIGQKLAERYDAKDRGMAKIAGDYEKLRRDLNKESQEHEKTRMDLKQMSRELDRSEKKNAELESKLAIVESRGRHSFSRLTNNELQEENKRLLSTIEDMRATTYPDETRFNDLMRRYKEATNRNAFLEKQLRNFSEQFGVAINLKS